MRCKGTKKSITANFFGIFSLLWSDECSIGESDFQFSLFAWFAFHEGCFIDVTGKVAVDSRLPYFNGMDSSVFHDRVTIPLYKNIEAIGYDLYLCTVSNNDKVIVNGKGEILMFSHAKSYGL